MKTAVMFAGVDALDEFEKRKQALEYPEVRARLKQAQGIISKIDSSYPDLAHFVASPDEIFHRELFQKAFVSSIVQVGLYDRYISHNPEPDLLLGCSLGDSARSVCSGAMTFEQMVYGTYVFYEGAKSIKGGSIVRVRKNSGDTTPEDLATIESQGLFIAVHQTPRHFLVSSTNDKLMKWALSEETRRSFSIKPLYNAPLHSPLMAPALQKVRNFFSGTHMKNSWSTPIFATALRRFVNDERTLHFDIDQNMTGAVYWWQSFKSLAEKHGVERFVNIGPANTLLRFAERIPLACPVNLMDIDKLCSHFSSAPLKP